MKTAYKSLVFLIVSIQLVACGGGGGGGGGGRTTDTALRLIHAAVALAPLDVRIGELDLQRAHYGQLSSFVKVDDKGPQSVVLQRANTVGAAFRTLSVDFADDTEYTIFIFGGRNAQSDGVAVFPEPVERPETGFARVQLLNGFESGSSVTVTGLGLSSSLSAGFGGGSGFVTIPSGPQEFVAKVGSSEFARVSVDVADRGEITLVASGSNTLGYRKLKVYTDLD